MEYSYIKRFKCHKPILIKSHCYFPQCLLYRFHYETEKEIIQPVVWKLPPQPALRTMLLRLKELLSAPNKWGEKKSFPLNCDAAVGFLYLNKHTPALRAECAE